MSTLRALYARHGNSLREFIKFGVIGGSGVLVNMMCYVLANQIAIHAFGSHEYDRLLRIPVPGQDWSLRNYLLYSVIAFLAANLYNFVLNRYYTFKQDARAPFLREYGPFLLVGSVAQLLGLVILQLLMDKTSPLYLSADFFTDGSPFWRRRAYWAQLIQIVIVMPINFVVNKLWTFRAVRRRHGAKVGS